MFADGAVLTRDDMRLMAIDNDQTAGDDVVNGTGHDDVLEGALGNDILNGGGGADTYYYSSGDGNDVVNDESTSNIQTDKLIFRDINASDVQLSHVGQSLMITILATGETIEIRYQFVHAAYHVGIEEIVFADGTVWDRADFLQIIAGQPLVNSAPIAENDEIDIAENTSAILLASDLLVNDNDSDDDDLTIISVQSAVNGAASLNSSGDVVFTPDADYSGSASFTYTISDGNGGESTAAVTLIVNALSSIPTTGNDNLIGTASNDDIYALQGDDIIEGGLGDDNLYGAQGSDTYYYSSGDGNDYIDDEDGSTTSIDRLVFRDINPNDVRLSIIGGNDLLITIIATGETVRLDEQFYSPATGYGFEEIVFADGTIWDRSIIRVKVIEHAQTDGDDTINGTKSDDVFEGGLGDDSLYGSHGSDTYYYSSGDGNDYIDDEDGSTTSIDRLVFRDINPNDVRLSIIGGNDLLITIIATGETVRLDEQFYSPATGYGFEEIVFADGTIWDRIDIAAQIIIGTSLAEVLNGTANNDTISGLAGDDILNGNDGNDLLIGGEGADSLDGGAGIDTASYEDSTSGVYVHMLDHAQNTGDALGDTYNSIENLKGSDYDDTLIATDDDNFIWADEGDDIVLGLEGDDTIYGGAGDDQLYGNEGDDVLVGDIGADSAFGDEGEDRIDLGDGDDYAEGGSGNDTFVFRSGLGNDYIADFQGGAGASDIIELQGMGISSYAQLQAYMSEWNGTTYIDFDANNSITLEGVTMASLDADDFSFV